MKYTDQVHELQSFQKFAVLVFQSMGFIDHHTTPVELPQLWAVGHYHLKSGDQPVKLQHAGDSVSLNVDEQHHKNTADLYSRGFRTD